WSTTGNGWAFTPLDGGTSFTDFNVTSGNAYYFSVFAKNAGSQPGLLAIPAGPVTIPFTSGPTISASTSSGGEVVVSWNSITTLGGANYFLERSIDGGAFAPLPSDGGPTTTVTNTPSFDAGTQFTDYTVATPDAGYSYRVHAATPVIASPLGNVSNTVFTS